MKFLEKYKALSAPAKAAVWFVVCNVINKGISLLATPILTRIMTTDQYGTFSVFQSWVSIMTIFCTLNLFGNAYSRGRLDFKGNERQFESSLLALSMVLTLALFIVFCIAPVYWSGLMGLSPFLVVLLFVEIALMSATSFWSACQRFEYHYKALVLVTIATNIFSLGAGVLAILSTDAKVEARVIMDVIAKGVPGVILMFLIFARGKCFFNKEYWKYGIAFTVPLLPHFLSHYVLNQSDRLMISQMVDNSAAALYSVSYSIAMALVIVATAINDSYCPYTFQELDEGRVDGVRMSGHLILALVGALTVMVMAFAPEVLSVFAGPEYSDAVDIIPPLSASVFFIFFYSMMSNLEYFYKKTSSIAMASVVSAILNIALNLVLIPKFGYKAAAWTTLFSYMVLAFMHWAFSARICRAELGRQVYSARYLLLSIIVLLAVTLGMDAVYGMTVVRYAVLLAITACLFVKRSEIITVVRRKG
ncbi:lipopolysaccharide biosynthesis protein [Paratractidigestivibacter faecalis]|uniref:lipopolysaccharide biosynthesis protein n=1 Tax=Paratractidigestivibacter faecalis TaxID=2292441 RepID=UPI003F94E2C9